MLGAAPAAGNEPASAPPTPPQPTPPPLHLPPHLVAYLSSPAVTAFLSSLAPHFPSYSPDEVSMQFATLLAARYRHSPSCTSQLQWTQKYAPASVNELWSHAPQTATLRRYTEQLKAATATAAMPSLLLVGPSSSSKTAAAYAIASTLQSAVIEVHPGMARSGRDVQALCGEATQSHRLHGDRKDVWAVVREERWRSWEKSNQSKKEEQREPEEREADDRSAEQTASAKRVPRSKRVDTPSSVKIQSRRSRKQQRSADSEQSEAEAHSDVDVPDRLVIRLKLRSNNCARLLSCPVVQQSPPQPQQAAGKRKDPTSVQKNGTIASFFSHQTAGKEASRAVEEERKAAVVQEQAEDEDEVVIERTEGVIADNSSASKQKHGRGKRKGKQQASKAIAAFFTTTPATSRQRQHHEETKEEPNTPRADGAEKVYVAEERKEQTGGISRKKRRRGKRDATVGIGSFFTTTVHEVEDEVESEREDTEGDPTGVSEQPRIMQAALEDVVIEEKEDVTMRPTVTETVKEEESDKQNDSSSKRKVQKSIGGFFGGKSEVIVLADTTNGRRRGRKGKKAAAAIDLTSPPPTGRNGPPTPPSPPPTALASSFVSASAAQPSSSLILFEDVDLVFPTDVHFHRTLRSLVLTAKRPLLLTAQCVPSWVDEVSDDKLRIVQMARMGDQECVLHALLICAVETGVDADDSGGKDWSCLDVARLCCWWQYDVRRVLMTLQVLIGARDTHAFAPDASVDETLLPPTAATALLCPPPSVSSPSSLLLSVVGLSPVSSPLLSIFSSLHPSPFALLCSNVSSIDITHLNWASSVQRRAFNVMQRLPLSEKQVTASVEEMVSVADVPAGCVHVVIEPQQHDTDAGAVETVAEVEAQPSTEPSASVVPGKTMREATHETAHNAVNLSQQDDEVELGSSRRVNGKRTVIAEDDDENAHDEPMHSDNDRLDSDVILIEPPSPLVDPKWQHDIFMLHVRQLACQQLREREQQHRLAYAASSSPSLAQRLACRFLQSVASLSSLLADCNILSRIRLLPLSSTVPSSLLYQRHPSLPPQYIDVNVPYSGSSYRCAEWWLTGENDGLRGEMDEERRDEQPMCEKMFEELTAEMEAMGLSAMRRAIEQLEADTDGKTAAELHRRQEGAVAPPRRTPLGRQRGPIEVVVSADTVPLSFAPSDASTPAAQQSDPITAAFTTISHSTALLLPSTVSADSPFSLELAPPRLPTTSSPAARLSTIDASRALFSSLRCKLHAPSSRTWLTDIYPFLCEMGAVEGQRENERRAEELKAREQRDRVTEERRVRRQTERDARQLKRKERKRARKEKRKRKRVEPHLPPTTSSSSDASDSYSDDSGSSHTSGSSENDDDSDNSSERVVDFFAPRGSASRRSRRRHLSSRRVAAAEGGAAREELHVCGGLSDALYEEVMSALRLPRWRDWSDE